MSVYSRRSGTAARALLAAGMVASAAAGCASQGLTPGGLPSGATGSVASSLPSAAASTTASGPGSVSPSDPSSSAPFALPTTSDPAAATSSATGQVYKVTDTVTEGGFKIKIHSVTLPYHPPAGLLFTPAPNRAWLVLDFEVTEVSDQPSMFSTIGAFALHDSTGAGYIISVAYEQSLPKDKVFQDHEMKPGEKAGGEVVFDVPQTAKGFLLTFKGNMWHASQTPPVIDLGR